MDAPEAGERLKTIFHVFRSHAFPEATSYAFFPISEHFPLFVVSISQAILR
jgi:hypothetical protein